MQPLFQIDKRYLSHLGEEEFTQLLPITQFKAVAKNEILIPANKPVKDIYYVHKGVVRLFIVDSDGREINTHLAWSGMFVTSYYSLLKNQPSDEALIAVTDGEVFHFPYEKLHALFEAFPKMERLGRILAEESFSCLAERGRLLQTMKAKERYLYFIQTTPTEIFRQIPMQDIASYLGITPGSLSRIRHDFLHIC